MKVAIRADASPAIGSGHVARCLALADALAARGAEVRFVSRPLPPHLAESIRTHGHGLAALDLELPAGNEAPQQAWPAAVQGADAAATRAALDGFAPDWLVADHYGLDAAWEAQMRASAARILAIDDLGRRHACDLLLDANYHPEPAARYADTHGARLLLGPSHALLRPEFARARAQLRPRGGPVRRLLVFLGGMDAGNATGQVLQAITLLRAPAPALDVVIGASHPARAEIEAFCRARPGSRCHVQTQDMAGLLAGCDAAVGAGGGATWERCCLGVPTLALVLAPNQAPGVASLAAAGVVLAPDGGLPPPPLLAVHIEALLHNTGLRQALAAASLALVDGRGAERVTATMLGARIRVRPATGADSERLHAWRNAPAVRAVSRQQEEIPLDAHRRWLAAALAAPDRVLLVGEDALGPVGLVRFDLRDHAAEVSIHLAPQRHGQGLGPGLLAAAESWLAAHRPEITQVDAEVLAGNAASARLFAQAGYRAASQRFSKRTATP